MPTVSASEICRTPESISRPHASATAPRAPRVAIGIPEGHGEIGHHIQPCVAGQRRLRPSARPAPAPAFDVDCAGEIRAISSKETQESAPRRSAIARSAPLAFTTMPMISTASGGLKQLQHAFGVRHLRNRRRRNETHSIDVRESRLDEPAQIAGLRLRRNHRGQALPRIARALDDFDGFAHEG